MARGAGRPPRFPRSNVRRSPSSVARGRTRSCSMYGSTPARRTCSWTWRTRSGGRATASTCRWVARGRARSASAPTSRSGDWGPANTSKPCGCGSSSIPKPVRPQVPFGGRRRSGGGATSTRASHRELAHASRSRSGGGAPEPCCSPEPDPPGRGDERRWSARFVSRSERNRGRRKGFARAGNEPVTSSSPARP